MSRYIVKLGDYYADGQRHWMPKQAMAFVFTDANAEDFGGGKQYAACHASTFADLLGVRIVRLTP